MHALSLPTWWIHVASVLEWVLAMLAIQRWGLSRGERAWSWLATVATAGRASSWLVMPPGSRNRTRMAAGS